MTELLCYEAHSGRMCGNRQKHGETATLRVAQRYGVAWPRFQQDGCAMGLIVNIDSSDKSIQDWRQ